MRKGWTIEEIEYLKENIGFRKISTIAQALGRSYESVRVKMNRLGLSNTKSQIGLVTIGEISKILKVERNTVKGWVERYNLPCTKKVTRDSKIFYFIDSSDFWKWAEIHKEKVQFSNIDSQVLLPEPDWVAKERQRDKQTVKKKGYKYWTTKEDQRLLDLRKQGLTYFEVGQRMNRSSISIERRYKRIVNM